MDLLNRKTELLNLVNDLNRQLKEYLNELKQIDIDLEQNNQLKLNANINPDLLAINLCNTKGIDCNCDTLILFIFYNMKKLSIHTCSPEDIASTLKDRGYECNNILQKVMQSFELLLDKKLISQEKKHFFITEKGIDYVNNLIRENSSINIDENLLLQNLQEPSTIAQLTERLIEKIEITDPMHLISAVKKLISNGKVKKIEKDEEIYYCQTRQ